MKTVPQSAAFAHFHRTIAALCPDADTPTPSSLPDWTQAVAQIEAALRTTLRRAKLTRRLRTALHLVRIDAVDIHPDGTTVMQDGTPYPLEPHCPCPAATQGATLCPHVMAAELYRVALRLICPF